MRPRSGGLYSTNGSESNHGKCRVIIQERQVVAEAADCDQQICVPNVNEVMKK